VRDLALDADGDLELTDGALRLTSTADGENVAQRLRVRLRLWRGDYVMDTRVGIPFRRWLGQKGAAAVELAEAVLRRAVATCPGVGRVNAFTFALDGATRRAAVDFEVTTDTGAAVASSVFVEGA
jgi:hypothetical protein